jgi:hypothetical protein
MSSTPTSEEDVPQSKMQVLAQGLDATPDVSPRPTLITAGELKPGMVWMGDLPLKVLEISFEEEPRICVPWDQGRDHGDANARPMHMVIIKGEQENPGHGIFKGTWKVQPDTPIEVTYGAGEEG